jgi:hypothetical protein
MIDSSAEPTSHADEGQHPGLLSRWPWRKLDADLRQHDEELTLDGSTISTLGIAMLWSHLTSWRGGAIIPTKGEGRLSTLVSRSGHNP